ncbi:hypothetical protein [Dyadobacter sediminis]|uniref:Uncharacterized protein n=1 Tax=Dyadobacter sediminis TaxID=1493691 RepID=A0A5R9KIL2_9BACT|nr:hypothetical protein [Dyadobacter sediminis]TLU96045.1 hypothetical protein FEM55_02540 [Dyadobacter sediminis]GGB78777.1 hypothetical protein GCM10011325_02900 [Dyadobacter sediminis]
MKNILLWVVGFLLHTNAFGQGIQELPKRLLSTNIGAGKHGTGDLYGLMVGFEYEKQFRPKLSWSTELAMTIHDGEDLLLVQLDHSPQEDMSYRFTTAGMQLAGKIGYHAVRTKNADIGIKLGVAARYQSTSLADDRVLLFPALTGYPYPLRILRNTEPQRTIAAVAITQLFARYTFGKDIVVGALAGMQLDTNGDVIIPQFSISIGKRF